MKDDRFVNLEKDIIRSVGRILSSQELSELKNTVFSAMDQVEQAATRAAKQVDAAARASQQATSNTAHRASSRVNQTNYENVQGPYYTQNYDIKQKLSTTPTTYRNLPVKGSTSSGLWLAGSICGIVFSALTIPAAIISSIFTGINAAVAAIPFATLAASITSTVFAGKSIARIGRFKKYLKSLGKYPMYTVKEIASYSHVSEEQVNRDMPKFLKAVSLPYAKMDDDNTCLILDKDTYQQYLDMKENRRRIEAEEEARKARIASDPNAAAVDEMKKNGSEYLRKIRLANDALPAEDISNKLDKLAEVCRRIFSYVEENPSKLPQIRKMMSYYLPMTLKLVEAYVKLENQPVPNSSISDSKVEIESALDKIYLAFENLYSRLMENDLMDLSADISVLETMLAQEGLTNNNINPL